MELPKDFSVSNLSNQLTMRYPPRVSICAEPKLAAQNNSRNLRRRDCRGRKDWWLNRNAYTISATWSRKRYKPVNMTADHGTCTGIFLEMSVIPYHPSPSLMLIIEYALISKFEFLAPIQLHDQLHRRSQKLASFRLPTARTYDQSRW